MAVLARAIFRPVFAYRVLHLLMGVAIRLYFGRIHRQGLRCIEEEPNRPLLILANHTSAFLDPMLLAIFLRRRIHFFVRGDAFDNPGLGRFFRSLGMLPIFRQSEGQERMQHNDQTNAEAVELLKGGAAILIFAEGFSDTAKAVKPLKKGPFRLALQCVESGGPTPCILPLGINYEDQQQDGRQAWLRAGTRLDSAAYLGGSNNKAQGILSLMRSTAGQLPELAFDAGTLEQGQLVNRLLPLSGARTFDHIQQLCARAKNWDPAALAVAQDLAQAVERLPECVVAEAGRKPVPVWACALIVLLSPWAMAGWLVTMPPVALARLAARRISTAEDFFASIFISLSMAAMLLWSIGWAVALGLWHGLGGVALSFALLFSGVLFNRFYLPVWRRCMCRLQWATQPARRRHEALELRRQYVQLLQD